MADAKSVDEFVRDFEGAVEGIEPNSLGPETEFKELEEWDSLAALTVLAMVDADYEVEISGNELRGARRIADLYTVIQAKRSS